MIAVATIPAPASESPREPRRHGRRRSLGRAIAAALRLGRRAVAQSREQRALRQAIARAEAALHELRQSEARFRDIAEVAAELIWETDEHHRFVAVTGHRDSLVDRDGAQLDVPVGKTRWELAGANPLTDPLWREYKAVLDAHRPFRQFRYSCVKPSGQSFHFAVNGKPVFDEMGRFKGYRGTASLENEIVAAQTRARRAETLLRDAVSSISEGFVIYDEDDRLFLCNDAYRRLYPETAPAMVPGARFEDILRAGLKAGQYPAAKGDEAEWLAERMRRHRELGEEHEQLLPTGGGRWSPSGAWRAAGRPGCASTSPP